MKGFDEINMNNLLSEHCVPCEGGTPPLSKQKSAELLEEIDNNWTLIEEKELEKTYSFKNFTEAINFINKIAKVAESEGHHPDISLHNYKLVTIKLSTHAIGGLSDTDFTMASKIDGVFRPHP